MLKSSLCDYSDAYILVSGAITIIREGEDVAAKQLHERNKGVTFKNFAPFIDSISKINNTKIDNAKDLDVAMPMYNLIEYSDNYLKTSRSLWQYYTDDPNDDITEFEWFKYTVKIAGKTPAASNTNDVKITVPLKYLSNFWRTLKITLINYEINLILTWSTDYVISSANGATKFNITDTKIYTKLLKKLKSVFKRTINWNKYPSKISTERKNQYLDLFLSYKEYKTFYLKIRTIEKCTRDIILQK